MSAENTVRDVTEADLRAMNDRLLERRREASAHATATAPTAPTASASKNGAPSEGPTRGTGARPAAGLPPLPSANRLLSEALAGAQRAGLLSREKASKTVLHTAWALASTCNNDGASFRGYADIASIGMHGTSTVERDITTLERAGIVWTSPAAGPNDARTLRDEEGHLTKLNPGTVVRLVVPLALPSVVEAWKADTSEHRAWGLGAPRGVRPSTDDAPSSSSAPSEKPRRIETPAPPAVERPAVTSAAPAVARPAPPPPAAPPTSREAPAPPDLASAEPAPADSRSVDEFLYDIEQRTDGGFSASGNADQREAVVTALRASGLDFDAACEALKDPARVWPKWPRVVDQRCISAAMMAGKAPYPCDGVRELVAFVRTQSSLSSEEASREEQIEKLLRAAQAKKARERAWAEMVENHAERHGGRWVRGVSEPAWKPGGSNPSATPTCPCPEWLKPTVRSPGERFAAPLLPSASYYET